MALPSESLAHGKDIFHRSQTAVTRIPDMLDIYTADFVADSHLLDNILISTLLAGADRTHNQSPLLMGQADNLLQVLLIKTRHTADCRC